MLKCFKHFSAFLTKASNKQNNEAKMVVNTWKKQNKNGLVNAKDRRIILSKFNNDSYIYFKHSTYNA